MAGKCCPKCGDHIYSGDDECLTCRPTPEKTPEKPRRVRLSTVRVEVELMAKCYLELANDLDPVTKASCKERAARVMDYLAQRERDDVRERAALIACQALVDADDQITRGSCLSPRYLLGEAAEQARAALADD